MNDDLFDDIHPSMDGELGILQLSGLAAVLLFRMIHGMILHLLGKIMKMFFV